MDTDYFRHLSDPHVSGPGSWYSMHVLSRRAHTTEEKQRCIQDIHTIVENFKCLDCRQHGMEYIRYNPPEHCLNMRTLSGADTSLFDWTVDYHNSVNMRTGKMLMDRGVAYALYAPDAVCAARCGANHAPSPTYTPYTPPLTPTQVVYTPTPRLHPNRRH